MLIYESHLGGIYFSDEIIDNDQLYCETCNDSDIFIGEADSFAEAWEMIEDRCSIFGSGGIPLQYIFPSILSAFSDDSNIIAENIHTDDNGFCDLTDKEILERIGNIIGRKFKALLVETEWGDEIIAADKKKKAKDILFECDWIDGKISSLKYKEMTLEEVEKYLKEEYSNA